MQAFEFTVRSVHSVHRHFRNNPQATNESAGKKMGLFSGTVAKFRLLPHDVRSVVEVSMHLNQMEIEQVETMLREGNKLIPTAAFVGMRGSILRHAFFGIRYLLDELRPVAQKYPLAEKFKILKRVEETPITREALADELGMTTATLNSIIYEARHHQWSYAFYKAHGLTTTQTWLAASRLEAAA